ncbi:MAG: thiazole synthase [Kiritimatiellae bacterium]|nr:thiazole synthase [Kiritimatiellia bacterium]
MKNKHTSDPFVLGGYKFSSRLIMGTGKFSDSKTMAAAVRISGARLVTVALRRINPKMPADDLLAPLRKMKNLTIMPNTSGARDAREAVKAAHIARELSGSRFIKVEIHPNPMHLMPDPIETLEAARILAAEGFLVMPYMGADPVLAKRLEDAGCVSVMPLGSAIGSGRGIAAAELLKLIIRESRVPVIIDAGLRSPSEAAAAMEMGCAAVLVNSAIAAAGDPAAMAAAFARAVEAGRAACLAGLMPQNGLAAPTSPLTSFLSKNN